MTTVDVACVGGGIMSATLATLLHELQPDWSIAVYERLDEVGREASDGWNNAGTGHAALCELNYTPEGPDGTIEIAKAVAINDQFATSQAFWDHLVAAGRLPDGFRSAVPHLTFVRGEADVDFLRRRWRAMTADPHFADLEYTEDPATIAEWAPLLMAGRAPGEPVAATRAPAGTDVDFGVLTRALLADLRGRGVEVRTGAEVRRVRRAADGGWTLRVRHRDGGGVERVHARFVFVGAGGGALRLLQSAGIPEIRGYGGFPVSGKFLRTTRPDLAAAHRVKVYGKASVGSPPMSVPHLDARVVEGRPAVLFGPFAGWSMRFLRHGSAVDLLRTVRPHNLLPMLAVAAGNLGLLRYLAGEVLASPARRTATLRGFLPAADPADWELITAGQRVQIIKPHPTRRGVLEFGTEVVASADGSIAGLLGASPGASTAVHAMTGLLRRCFPRHAEAWQPRLAAMGIPPG